MLKKFSSYFFILFIILFTVNTQSYSELSPLNSGEVWGVSRTKINNNLTDLETRKMNKSTYDANSDGKIDSTALPTNIPTTETVGQLVEDAVTEAVEAIPGSTVVPDESDPTKAAAAVVADSATTATTADSATTASHATTADSATTAGSATTADSATYATTAGTAGTVTAVSGTAITSGTVDEARIDANIARDSEVADAISGIVIPPPSTILPDGTDPTKAAAAVTADSATTATTATSATSAGTADHATTADSATTAGSATVADSATTADHATTADSATTATSADTATTATTATTAGSADYATSSGSAASVDPVKTSGVAGIMSVFEANGTSTLKTGFIGPDNSTVNFVYKFPDSVPSSGDTFVMGTPATGQPLPDGSTGTIIPMTHAAGGGGSVNDTAFGVGWDGDTTTAASKNALYDKIAALETQVTDMIAAFSAAGLNSFTFAPSVTYPIWASSSPVAVSFDVTDTSSTYIVSDVDYQYDGVGGFVENMTNTTGDTWTASVAIATDGAHTIQLEAVDDKSPTPNSGQSAVYTINFDGTDPVVGTVTPDPATHDGTGTAVTVTVDSITEINELAREYQIYNVTDAAVVEEYQAFTGLTINETLPADQDTYRIDVRVTDLAGNAGTASSADIDYSAGGLSVNDLFDGTENPLVTNWTSVGYANWGGFQKAGGSAYGIAAEWNGSYWDADSLANNQYGKITLTGAPGYHGVMVRQNANGCYTAYASSHGNRVYVNRFDVSGAVWTNLVDGAAYITTTVPSGATIELRFSGSTPTVLVNGTPVGTLINDSTYGSGNAGVISYGTAVGIDSFEAGDL